MAMVTPFVQVGTYPTRNFATFRDRYSYGPPFTGASIKSFACANPITNLPALAGVTPYTSTFVFAECCVLINSPSHLVTVTPRQLHPQGTSLTRANLLPKLRFYFA